MPVEYCHIDKMTVVLEYLVNEILDEKDGLAAAVGTWTYRNLSKNMRYVGLALNGVLSERHAHFTEHPQIGCTLIWLNNDELKYLFPIATGISERCFKAYVEVKDSVRRGFVVLENGFERCEAPWRTKNKYIPNSGFVRTDVFSHIHAMVRGIMTKEEFFTYAFERKNLRHALHGVTEAMAGYLTRGGIAAVRGSNSGRYRRDATDALKKLFGKTWGFSAGDDGLIVPLKEVYEKPVGTVVTAAFLREDRPTDSSYAVGGIKYLCGVDTFIRMLSALGKDPIERSSYYGLSDSGQKRLSHLLGVCIPAEGDTAESLGKLLKKTPIAKNVLSKQRYIQTNG